MREKRKCEQLQDRYFTISALFLRNGMCVTVATTVAAIAVISLVVLEVIVFFFCFLQQ